MKDESDTAGLNRLDSIPVVQLQPDDAPTRVLDPESLELGQRIRSLRIGHRLTIEALAALAGVSRSLVSQIELGRATPSIGTLRGLARALDVPMAAMFVGTDDTSLEDLDRSGRRVVVRADKRKRLHARRSSAAYELLTPDLNRKIEFIRTEFAPGASAPPERGAYVAHQGEENMLCLQGSLLFVLDGQEFILREGDSASFDCSLPHRLENRGASKAVLICAISPPTF